jgi:beta-glucosidase
MAGRPLTIEGVIDKVDAVLYAWHPGTMGGPAIADLLFGRAVPSGKLPITFPRMVGQVPIYYAQKNTGRPATDDTVVNIDTVEPQAPQTSLGMTSFHLDAGHRPLFPFGYGLSYTQFEYQQLELSSAALQVGEELRVSAEVINSGDVAGEEIVQLYVRDLVGRITRPVRELKGFKRISLQPGERQRVAFTLTESDLGFYDDEANFITEPGQFQVWIGADSQAELGAGFELLPRQDH